MSPARGKKAKSSSSKKPARASRPAARPAKRAGRKAATKAAKPGSKAKARPASGARKASAAPERRHCAATDPFGDPCQSAPRLPSKYCTIHSYLDR